MRKLSFTACVTVGLLLMMATAFAIQSQLSTGTDEKHGSQATDDGESVKTIATHPVTVRTPSAPHGVETGKVDRNGNPIRLSCRNCHDIRPANKKTSATEQLDEFHQGLTFHHGKLACVACHNADDGYTTLHLADGSPVEYADTMTLCAQCHGTQHRDYQNGSHGGMTGYWDLTKGPRKRNHCIDCHDPHSPTFPQMYPAPGPNDRFAPAHKDAVH